MTHDNTKKKHRKNKIKTKKGGNKQIISSVFNKKHINKKNFYILLSLYALNNYKNFFAFMKTLENDRNAIKNRDNSRCQVDVIFDILRNNDVKQLRTFDELNDICTFDELNNKYKEFKQFLSNIESDLPVNTEDIMNKFDKILTKNKKN